MSLLQRHPRDGREGALLSRQNNLCGGLARVQFTSQRAILRSVAVRSALAVEKYEQWRDIDPTFDPERTSLR